MATVDHRSSITERLEAIGRRGLSTKPTTAIVGPIAASSARGVEQFVARPEQPVERPRGRVYHRHREMLIWLQYDLSAQSLYVRRCVAGALALEPIARAQCEPCVHATEIDALVQELASSQQSGTVAPRRRGAAVRQHRKHAGKRVSAAECFGQHSIATMCDGSEQVEGWAAAPHM